MARLPGGTFYCDGNPVPLFTVTGNWNVNINPRTPAQVTLNVFYNGSHHLSFGYNALMLVSSSGGVYVFSGFLQRDGDAQHECNSGDVLLARRTRRRLSIPSIPTTR